MQERSQIWTGPHPHLNFVVTSLVYLLFVCHLQYYVTEYRPTDFSDSVKKRDWAKVQLFCLTLLWRRPLSYRNQSINLGSKSMDWFLYDNGLRHERLKQNRTLKI